MRDVIASELGINPDNIIAMGIEAPSYDELRQKYFGECPGCGKREGCPTYSKLADIYSPSGQA